MNYLGIEYEMKHAPKLDPGFIPFGVWSEAYLKDAKMPLAIAVERDKGRISVHHTHIHGTPEMVVNLASNLSSLLFTTPATLLLPA